MKAAIHEVRFDGRLLRRGFWLYVWEISPSLGTPVYYVGRTGDSSSLNAQSPFSRIGAHLAVRNRGNMLRKHLTKRGINPELCVFRFASYGPILPEAAAVDGHRRSRDTVAAMECALAAALLRAGCDVLNRVNCRKPLDRVSFGPVLRALAEELRLPLTAMRADQEAAPE